MKRKQDILDRAAEWGSAPTSSPNFRRLGDACVPTLLCNLGVSGAESLFGPAPFRLNAVLGWGVIDETPDLRGCLSDRRL